MTYTAPTFLDGLPYPAAVWQALADEVARMSPIVAQSTPQYVSSTSASSAIGTSATAILTLNSCVFSAGRAYAVEIIGGLFGSTSNFGDFSLWKTSTAGTQIGAFYRTPSFGAPQMNAYGKIILRRSAGTDLTINVVLALTASTGTVTHDASSNRPRALLVTDVGTAAAYPWAQDVT